MKVTKTLHFQGFFAENGPWAAIPRFPYFTGFSTSYHHFSDTSLTSHSVATRLDRMTKSH